MKKNKKNYALPLIPLLLALRIAYHIKLKLWKCTAIDWRKSRFVFSTRKFFIYFNFVVFGLTTNQNSIAWSSAMFGHQSLSEWIENGWLFSEELRSNEPHSFWFFVYFSVRCCSSVCVFFFCFFLLHSLKADMKKKNRTHTHLKRHCRRETSKRHRKIDEKQLFIGWHSACACARVSHVETQRQNGTNCCVDFVFFGWVGIRTHTIRGWCLVRNWNDRPIFEFLLICFIFVLFFFSLFFYSLLLVAANEAAGSRTRVPFVMCVCVCDNFLAASILTRATIRSSLCVFADRANTWISSSSSPPHLLSNIPWLCTYVRTNVCRTCVRSLVAIAMSLVAVSAVGMVSLSSMRARTLYVPQHAI